MASLASPYAEWCTRGARKTAGTRGGWLWHKRPAPILLVATSWTALFIILQSRSLPDKGRPAETFCRAGVQLADLPSLRASPRTGYADRLALKASVGEATAAAAQLSSFPPPDWIHISTTVESEEAAQKVACAISEVSEGLRPESREVRRLRRGADEAAWALSVWVPPKAMLLVTSMIGEALEACSQEQPMVLAEGLDFDGDPEFFRCEVAAPKHLDFTSLLEEGLAAAVELDEAAASASLHTTAAKRSILEAWLTAHDADASTVHWNALGGNAEYLNWVTAETASNNGDAGDAKAK
eukprot:TRINITY_DN48644_c0_g1_i1.p1 TRINITY_DN48644_c0_g1~~TRINITY_DN48644_c0_g1_i1.p1  ORF type:complete len:308 (+),score=67.63 TRINITY_DN48644_c0_g1_i1:36-926(+)